VRGHGASGKAAYYQDTKYYFTCHVISPPKEKAFQSAAQDAAVCL
jgi:hypothetical protein